MKSAPFVLASQIVPVQKASKKVMEKWGGGEDEYEREWVLCKASDVSATICHWLMVGGRCR